MKKNINLLLAAILLSGIFCPTVFGFANPLKNYDLYSDTHTDSSPRDNIMSEMYYTDQAANSRSTNRPPQQVPTTKEGGVEVNVSIPQRRNVYLRESSRKVYGQGTGSWFRGPYFYNEPNIQSIEEKYRSGNFAGCMQECEAYVKNHPNDTLGFYYLAMSYAKCGQKENAILAYEKVIKIHENPMIVKYATNGRNCVMGNEEEAKCFQNINEPDLYYPYREMAQEIGLTPVDPQELIERNFAELSQKFNNVPVSSNEGDDNAKKIPLPFENQDESLDRFIKAPYGTGFSPELELELRKQKLKNIQQEINIDSKNNPGKYFENIRNIKEFDQYKNKKSEGNETIKLAFADRMDVAEIFNNPEYIRNKKELDEIKMMFGDYNSNNTNDITSMLPQLAEDGKNIPPEVVQMMMMQSVTPNLIDTKSGF